MAVEKLSISMDAELAKLVRAAASDEGMSVSTWLSEAAQQRARQHALREALREDERLYGPISLEEARRGAALTRKNSIVIGPKRRRR